MGLDMYLYKVKDGLPVSEAIDIDRAWWNGAHYDADAGKVINEDMEPSLEEVMYWRKANMVHGFFERELDYCPNGRCTPVPRALLEELVHRCRRILDESTIVEGKVKCGQTWKHDHWEDIIEDGTFILDDRLAKALLPTTEGFFFGSYDYDQWYISDLEETIEGLTKVLEENPDDDWFVYEPSW